MVYRGLYSYRQRVRVITLFPNIFFLLAKISFIIFDIVVRNKLSVV